MSTYILEDLLPWMINHRRNLHKIPEVCHKEFKTSAYLQGILKELGLPFKTVKTGIVVKIDGTAPPPRKTLGFRADIDGLNITENTGLEYVSTHPGFMHACGHDGHMSILLGFAKYLTQNPPKHNVVLVFQPAEEGDAGALTMIESGLCDADVFYALHIDPGEPTGTVTACAGPAMAGAEILRITFNGVGRHAQFHNGKQDAILAAAKFLNDIEVLNTADVLFHTGVIKGGEVFNAVAEEAFLDTTLRFYSMQAYNTAIKKIEEVIDDIKKQDIGVGRYEKCAVLYIPVINTASEVEKLKNLPGFIESKRLWVAEDFAFFADKYSGFIAWLGAKTDGESLHSSKFTFDENALLKGVKVFIHLLQHE